MPEALKTLSPGREADSSMTTDLTEIKVSLARIEEQLKGQQLQLNTLAPASEVKQLRHDIEEVEKDLKAAESSLDAKIKIVDEHSASAADMNALVLRVEKLESNQSWLVRTIVGLFVAALAGIIGLNVKH